jgi:hypothetical protein
MTKRLCSWPKVQHLSGLRRLTNCDCLFLLREARRHDNQADARAAVFTTVGRTTQ